MSRTVVLTILVGVLVVGAALAFFSGDPEPVPTVGEGDTVERGSPRVMAEEAREAARLGLAHPRFREILDGVVPLDDGAASVLLGVAEDSANPVEMRHAAIYLVKGHPDPDIGPRILALMKGPPPLGVELMDAGLNLLAERKESQFAQDLVELAVLDDPHPEHVIVFAETIRRLEASVDTTPLVELVRRRQNPDEREMAATALIMVQEQGFSAAVDEIIRHDEEMRVRSVCIEAIKERRTPEDHRYLAGLVADESVRVETRTYIVMALGDGCLPEALPVLEDVLMEGTAPTEVLMGVAGSVGKQAPDGLARRLRGMLEPTRPETARRAVATALRLSGDREGLEDVRAALTGATTPPPELRAELARALGELGGRADLVALETLRDGDPDLTVRVAAGEALARLEEILKDRPDR